MYQRELEGEKRTVETSDGSCTLFSEGFGEAYHSPKDGALHETLEKHVRSALRFKGGQKRLNILDICFGLGYNTLATLYEINRHYPDTYLHIVSPELDRSLIESLERFDYPEAFAPLRPIIEALSREQHYEDARCRIDIVIGDAREFLEGCETRFDIVYQDAFSPRRNPLLWTKEYFSQIRRVVADDAILTTYSVAASTRMGLHENGFLLYEYRPEGARISLL
jgi:tRNA U34 5-methylaminomethyl-2-thiouridine-forming methyltransferase MnmC